MISQTVKSAADKAFPGMTYDCALPQAFLDDCLNNGFDIYGQCVWVYQDMSGFFLFGKPGPLTRAAAEHFKAQEIEYTEPAAWID